MKKLALAILSIFMTLVGSSFAKDAPSLLYQISGNGLTRPSYIFGTFHAVCPTEMVPFERLDSYLDQTDQLMMEIDMDDPSVLRSMALGVFMKDGKTMKDLLTAEEYAKVDEMIKNYLGYPLDTVKMVKPSMLTVLTLTSPKAIGCTPVTYDMTLMKNAVSKSKPVVGLETVESQVKVIDSLPLDKQVKGLSRLAADPQKGIDELKKLMTVYKSRDPEKLFAAANKQAGDQKEFQARLLDDRNADWIPKLEVAFKDKPTFVAVGAGHLGGKKGVLRLLRDKGYSVKPVNLSPAVAGGN
jgi:uncharacterized protein